MKRVILLSLATVALTVGGCSKSAPTGLAAAAPVKHEHKAPHGGTPVVLGHEAYHIEFVRDAVAGKLSAYILDGEMEDFIRIAAPSFDVIAIISGVNQTLTFKAVANAATGEKIGDTSQFEAEAEWLKGTDRFDGVIPAIEVRGTKFTAIGFSFPKGNDKD